MPALRERLLESEVRHQRADDAAGMHAAPPVVHRDHVQQLVAVVDAAVLVGDQQAVAVAVERDAEVRRVVLHLLGEEPRMRRADAGVDVEAVGFDADGDDLGAELVEHAGRDVVTRAVRTVDDDAETAQVRARTGNVLLQNST